MLSYFDFFSIFEAMKNLHGQQVDFSPLTSMDFISEAMQLI